MAAALLERGRIEDAAIAYRRAALDPGNPDPGKSLVNLGLCFMALGRHEDAVEAYQAALGFDEYHGRGKALANIGQAHAAMGEYDEAVRAFEKATQMHGHTLSSTAQRAYEDARALATDDHETVEGWETGEVPVTLDSNAGSAGWSTGELDALSEAAVSSDITATDTGEDTHRADDAAVALGMTKRVRSSSA
jgi:tetratricopeptide (TPR) repeat protein